MKQGGSFDMQEPKIRKDEILVVKDKYFHGKNVAVVTGAASGVGRATAIALAANGLAFVGTDVLEEGGKETVKMAEQLGGEVTFVKADLTKDEEIESIVRAALAVPLHLSWPFVLIGVVLTGIVLVSGVPVGFIFRRLLFLEPFVLGVSLLSLLRPGGGCIFLSLIVKSTISLLTMILLSNTTPFAQILTVLRRLRIPAILLTVLALMYRYLFVLIDEAERMGRARASRTFTSARGRWWRNGATVISQLFIRSSERADRIYAAMLARGWK